MKYFWTYETQLPQREEWKLFGKEHILWLLILVGSAALLLLVHGRVWKKQADGPKFPDKTGAIKNENAKKNRKKNLGSRLFRFMAWSSLLWQIAQALYRMILGVYDITTLPLHICSLASYLVFLYALTDWKWLGEVLYFPILPGAFLAILFPDWTMYPSVSFMSIAGFLVHWSIDMTVLLAIEEGRLRPSVHRIWSPILFLSVYAAVLIPFDHHFKVNYGFLNIPSPGSPLIAIADTFGSGVGYYVGYALVVAVCMALAYGIVYMRSVVRRGKRAQSF